MSTGRLESFSDGVIAVAATLLVLNLVVPAVGSPGGLAHALGREWPAYFAYAVSFITIGIIWINHHAMIGRLRQADHSILILNLVLLLTIGLLPFATNLLSSYLKASEGQHVAAAVYAGAFLLMAVAFAVLNWHILMRKAHLLHTELPYDERRRILMRSVAGLGPYIVATGVAFISPYATLAISAALAAFYALPIASGQGRRASAG
jgi:TMEM175 potassium channel family protein